MQPKNQKYPIDKLKQYRFDGELGYGTFSTVYKATKIDTGEIFAIKVFPKSNLRNRSDEARFQREADAMAYLRYENVVAMHDFFGIRRTSISSLTTARTVSSLIS